MRTAKATMALALAWTILQAGGRATAQDWPQWRGTNRDGKATAFDAPKTWPKELKKQWAVTVGEGVATPALVGDNLYVFTRQGHDEVIRCLAVADGKERWSDKYEAPSFTGPDSGFQGP